MWLREKSLPKNRGYRIKSAAKTSFTFLKISYEPGKASQLSGAVYIVERNPGLHEVPSSATDLLCDCRGVTELL